MTTQRYLTELHQDHREWKNVLSLYADDLVVMNKRLEEVSHKNTDREMHALVERFQNKLIIQAEQIDVLQHDINTCEAELVEEVKENATAVNRRKMDDHADLRDRMQTFELLFNKLRKDLNTFVAKWM